MHDREQHDGPEEGDNYGADQSRTAAKTQQGGEKPSDEGTDDPDHNIVHQPKPTAAHELVR